MSVEYQQVEEASEFKRDLKSQAITTGIRLAAPIIRFGTENILESIKPEYEDGFDAQIKEKADKGRLFLLVSDHQSLFDTLACLEPADHIREIAGFPGYFLPYTMTLATGHKGADTKGLQDVMAEKLDEHEVSRVFLSRTSDQRNFNTKANLSEVRDIIKEHMRAGFGGIIHAEGNLNGAREKGETQAEQKPVLQTFKSIFQSERERLSIERNGMQHFERNSLRSIIALAEELGIVISIVPITTSGTHNIHDPSTGTLTRSAIRTGFKIGTNTLAKVYVSNPIDVDEGELGEIRNRHKRMTHEDWSDFNSVIERKIAAHLPPKMRGVHS